MNRLQAIELHTLISTVRHVQKMDTQVGPRPNDREVAGCLLCEGVRHGLYTAEEGYNLDKSRGFAPHFGCTKNEADEVIHHWDKRDWYSNSDTTGEIYFQAGRELIEKYGFTDLFEEQAMPFAALMLELKQPVAA